MAQFPGTIVTHAGLAMITRSHDNADCLTFTRIAVGDGMKSAESPPVDDKSRLALIHETKSVVAIDFDIDESEGVATLTAEFDNKSLAAGFDLRELGVFARNADGVERLFCYAHDGDSGNQRVPGPELSMAGTKLVVAIAVGDAANVTAVIGFSSLATDKQVAALIAYYESTLSRAEALKASQQRQIEALERRLAAIEAGGGALWEYDSAGHLVPKAVTLVDTPSPGPALAYTGASQSPAWTGYDPALLELGGDTSATDAGEYAAIFTPRRGALWRDCTLGSRAVPWAIGKAAPALTASTDTVSLTVGQSATVTIGGDEP